MLTPHRRPSPVWIVLGLATALALAEAAQVQLMGTLLGTVRPWWFDLYSTAVAWFSMAALIPPIIWLARRYPWEVGQRLRRALPLLAGGLLFPLVHLGAVALLEYPVHVLLWPDIPLLGMYERLLGSFYVMELMTYVAILGIYLLWSNQRRQREREVAAVQLQLRARSLEAGLAEARLSALSAQLDPHFLFNTLNAISALAREGRTRGVVDVTTRLGSLLRHTLAQRSHWSRVRAEIGFTRQYLAIERVRFRRRLRVRWRVQHRCAGAVLPAMVLQPLIENALKHGIARLPEGGLVEVAIRGEGERLRVRVANTAPPAPAPAGREGVGLRNLRSRLDHLYGADYEFTAGPDGGGCFVAELWLPLKLSPREEERLHDERRQDSHVHR